MSKWGELEKELGPLLPHVSCHVGLACGRAPIYPDYAGMGTPSVRFSLKPNIRESQVSTNIFSRGEWLASTCNPGQYNKFIVTLWCRENILLPLRQQMRILCQITHRPTKNAPVGRSIIVVRLVFLWEKKKDDKKKLSFFFRVC